MAVNPLGIEIAIYIILWYGEEEIELRMSVGLKFLIH